MSRFSQCAGMTCDADRGAAYLRSVGPVALDLPGPSRRITVEPLRLPVPSPPPEPVPEPDPGHQLEPAPDREPAPA